MIKINNNIVQIILSQDNNYPDVNCYLLLKEKILIDAGPKSNMAFRRLDAVLRKLNMPLESLNMVILTHHHIDHVGLLQYFPQKLLVVGPDHLNFYSSKEYKNSIRNMLEGSNLTYEFKNDIEKHLKAEIIPPINSYNYVPFSEAKSILQKFNLKAMELSGHSREDILVIDSEGNYFSGDIVIPKIFFNCIYEVGESFLENQRQNYYKELDILASANRLILPGHGRVLTKEEVEKSILTNKKRMKRTEKKVIREINSKDIESICKTVFMSFLPYSKFLPFSEVSSICQEYKCQSYI